MSPDSFCISCGHTLVPGARFCGGCGRGLDDPEVPKAPPPPKAAGPQEHRAREVLRAEPVSAPTPPASPPASPATAPAPVAPADPPRPVKQRRLGGWSIAGLILLGAVLLFPFPPGFKVLALLAAGLLVFLRFLWRRRAGRIFLGLTAVAGLAVGGVVLVAPEEGLPGLGDLGATLESVGERVKEATAGAGEASGADAVGDDLPFEDPAPAPTPEDRRFVHPTGAFGLTLPEGWSGRATLAGLRLEQGALRVEIARLEDASPEAFLTRLQASVRAAGGSVSDLRRSQARLGARVREAFHLRASDSGGKPRESYGLLLPLDGGQVLVGADAEGGIEARHREAVHRLASILKPGRGG